MKLLLRLVFSIVLGLFGPRLLAGNLKVNLAPTGAVNAGAQWRVDGGTWRNSGAQVNSLSNTNHTVDYKTVSGWIAPASETVAIGGGTTTLSRTYTQAAGLKITLTPSSGQWRIDGGAWNASSATVTNLTPGSHSISYSTLNNYNAPATENVSLTAGQTTQLSRSYTALAQLTVTLTPSSGQWRVDGGAWQTSGATVQNLSVGSHTIGYNSLAGYSAPASEPVTLASGQSLSLNRNYVQLAQVTVTLTPSTGQWRVDGGAWTASGATIANLSPGSHTIDYSSLGVPYSAPPSEPVTLAAGQSLPLSRSYTQLNQVSVTLVPSNGQWRLDSGAWQASGASLWVQPGTHTIDYSALPFYDAPAADTITSGFGATRYYVSTKPKLRVNVGPAPGQWRLDGGAWQASGVQLTELTTGAHTIDYSDIGGAYAPIASENITLALRDDVTLTRTHQFANVALTVTLTPAGGTWMADGGVNTGLQASGATVSVPPGNYTVQYGAVTDYVAPSVETISVPPGQPTSISRTYAPMPAHITIATTQGGQWRVYPQGGAPGGVWQNSGDFIAFAPGNYTIEYSAVATWIAPTAENVTLGANGYLNLSRPYTAAPGTLAITLTPSSAQWRVDGGAWQASGATVPNLSIGSHTVDYAAASGYLAPASESVAVAQGQNVAFSRAYTALAQLTVNLTPTAAQWRVDGGIWQASGVTVGNLSLGAHTIDYQAVTGYEALASESVTLASGQSLVVTRAYTALAQLSITLTPGTAQWRVDNGVWQASGATVANLALGSHTIDYAPVTGYITPASESVTLTAGQSLALTRAYVQLAQVAVTLTPGSAQWRVDGGTWQNSGATVANLALGSHTIDYAPASGYITPASESVTLTAGQSLALTRSYVQLAQIAVTLTPGTGQWRVDGGAWQTSGATVANLTLGSHTIDYAALAGYQAPASESVTLTAGQSLALTRSYVQLATLAVTLTPSSGQWRVDGGAWNASGAAVANLAPGNHAVDYRSVANYDAPASETVTLAAGQNATLSRSYTAQPAQVAVTLVPATGQWRIYPAGSPGGAWQASATTVSGLAPGGYTIEYAALSGYTPPATENVTLTPAQSLALTRNYTAQPAQVTVATVPATGQWRIYSGATPSGAWNASGTTITGLTPGTYNVAFNVISGYTAPAPTAVTLAPGEAKAVTGTYAPNPTQINVALSLPTAQWRVDGGAWRAAGSSASGLAVGAHTLEFSSETGYASPPAQTITLNTGDSINYHFLYHAQGGGVINISLVPSQAKWRVDGGPWQISGATVANLSLGNHFVEYSDVPGYIAPSPQNYPLDVLNPLRYQIEYQRTFTGIWMTLNPSNAHYKVDGWGPGNSGSTTFVDSGKPYLYTYDPLAGYYPPHSEFLTVNLPQQSVPFTRNYATTAPTTATVSVGLNLQQGQWRLYAGGIPSGTWQTGSATITGLAAGDYSIEYAAVANQVAPTAESFTLSTGQDLTLSRTYTSLPGSVTVTLDPPGGQWAIGLWNGTLVSPWTPSGSTVTNVTPGEYYIYYSPVQDYLTPFQTYIRVGSAEPVTLTKTYQHVFDLSVSLFPYNAQWRIDGGAWQGSDAGVWGLAAGSHTIDYSPVAGYAPLASETINFTPGQSPITLYRSYQKFASVTVMLFPYQAAQWRVDGGAWQASEAVVGNLTFGVPHTIDYLTIPGYIAPPSETITLNSGQDASLFRSYQKLASLAVSLFPYEGAQWRVDGGAWQATDARVENLSFGAAHTIDYLTITGYIAPPSESITLNQGQDTTIYRSYVPLAKITASLWPSEGKFRVDGGAWMDNGTTVSNLAINTTHTIDYAPVAGWVVPPAESVSLYSGQNYQLSRSYAQLASATIYTSDNGVWRIDNGAWQTGNGVVTNLMFGVPHVLQFAPIKGYATPPAQQFTLSAGQSYNIGGYYGQFQPHRLRFFVHPDLAAGLTSTELKARLAQYAAHLRQIFERETSRTFATFNPDNDINIYSGTLFTPGSSGLENGYEVWVYALPTDNPAVGTYGGSLATDAYGASGLDSAKWDQIYDPSTLADGSPGLAQYWRQLHIMLQTFERMFGAGAGDYASLAGLHDASGVTPTLADTAAVDSASPDAFWNARFDSWTDPLTANAYANPRLGSPTSLATLLNLVSFAPATRGVINGYYRSPATGGFQVPDLSAVVVKVVDAQSGNPIPGAALRVWNRTTPAAPNTTYEETVTPTAPGQFRFSWTGGPAPFNSNENAKLLKATAPGYAPAAQWSTVYEAQKARLIDGKFSFEIIIPMTAQ